MSVLYIKYTNKIDTVLVSACDALVSLQRNEVGGGRVEGGERGRRGPVQLRLTFSFIIPMVIILEGSSSNVAHLWTEIGNLTCLRHSFSITVLN